MFQAPLLFATLFVEFMPSSLLKITKNFSGLDSDL